MNLDRLNQWLALGANVGVVVGFLLIAAQLNLNTEAIRLQKNFGADFVDAIDAELSSSDPELGVRQYRGMLADIRQLGQDDQSAP